MKTITVAASKTYDVLVGDGLLDKAGSFLRKTIGGQTVVIVADDNVTELYGKRLEGSLVKSGYRVAQFVFPHGESSKNWETFFSLLNFLAEEKFSRSDVIAALGGGVTGDLAGFAAASYMRGVPFVQIPTTLLAAVDSSVGGKTAINLASGKNLAGSFYQPDIVLCDVSAFSTLPPDVFRDGLAEVIKYGMIADCSIFQSLKTPVNTQLEDIITRCVEIKRDIVTEDEFEKGRRKLLNFGHTVGHAIELLSDYSISHGHAVAAGMAVITRAAVRLGLCKENCLPGLISMLERYELPVNTSYKADVLARACLSDKKRDGESLTMVFPLEIGRCILKEIPVDELESVIQLGLERNEK
ncbi:MAG: 3-dehydroquinate synthase [Treponema sp.]|nr:3-dehydroquinate synthase [Treponema sp.]